MKIEVIVKIDGVEVSRQEVEHGLTEDKPVGGVSIYARYFDETCPMWSRDPEANRMYLQHIQCWCNTKLKSVGYLFLNEVYDMLGFAQTKAGQVAGWIYKEDNPIGDNIVDFGIFTKDNGRFVNGYENSILLDFNVDGNILDVLK